MTGESHPFFKKNMFLVKKHYKNETNYSQKAEKKEKKAGQQKDTKLIVRIKV